MQLLRKYCEYQLMSELENTNKEECVLAEGFMINDDGDLFLFSTHRRSLAGLL